MVEFETKPTAQDEESKDESEVEKQPRRRNPNKRWNQEPRDDSKAEKPKFDGKTQGDELLEWLLTVDLVFDLKDYAEEQMVKLVAIKLKGYMSLWWENLKRDRESMGKGKIRKWSKMKRELQKRFIQETYQ